MEGFLDRLLLVVNFGWSSICRIGSKNWSHNNGGIVLKIFFALLIFASLFFLGCCPPCPEQDYTGWKRVQNEFYQDQANDSLWTCVDNGDYWTGTWEGKTFQFHLINDTIFFKEIDNVQN